MAVTLATLPLRTCAYCGKALPGFSRPDRRTCSNTCRWRLRAASQSTPSPKARLRRPVAPTRERVARGTETEKLLQEGKLSQTCPACGRAEAAGGHCSWCGRPMGPADYYPNGDQEADQARMPAVRPADPPSELRWVGSWPAQWGPYPYPRKDAGTSQARATTPSTPGVV